MEEISNKVTAIDSIDIAELLKKRRQKKHIWELLLLGFQAGLVFIISFASVFLSPLIIYLNLLIWPLWLVYAVLQVVQFLKRKTLGLSDEKPASVLISSMIWALMWAWGIIGLVTVVAIVRKI